MQWRMPLHVWQLAPPVPQAASVFPGWQLLLLQQPIGHEVALHTQFPPWQSWPMEHAPAIAPHTQTPAALQASVVPMHVIHTFPPAPQALALVAVTQVEPMQHPVQPDVVLQTHCPLMQRLPDPQAALVPHRHVPAEQWSAVLGSQVAVPQRHAPPEQRSVNPPHAGPPPQSH
jgi:hypothetical protein